MTSIRLRILLLAIALFAARESLAAGSTPHGSVELVAERTSIQPGQAIWVGLHFQLEKGWHIYWINPGDSGEPPRVKWNLPTGFEAGALEWPVPRRIQDHALIDYGYLGEVLLPVEIKTPARLKVGTNVDLSASVGWLVCREICVPARAALSLKLPVGKGTPSSWRSLFSRTREQLPKPAPKSWKLSARLDGQRFTINVDLGKPEREAVFFPFEPSQVENASPQKVNSYTQGLRLEVQKSGQLLKPPSELAGVLVLGSGQSYIIKAPMVSVSLERAH